MRKMVIWDSQEEKNLDEQWLFDVSDVVSRQSMRVSKTILDSWQTPEEKVKRILDIRKKWNSLFLTLDEDKLVKSTFTYDGGICLDEKDLEYITHSLFWISQDGEKQSLSQDIVHNPYIQSLYHDFCYIRNNKLNFRNEKYYFLFDSIQIAEIDRFTSVNDFEILRIDIDAFEKDIYTHFNRIDQHLKLFLDFFSGMTTYNIVENFDQFHIEMSGICNDTVLSSLKRKVESLKSISPDSELNNKILTQNQGLLELLQQLQAYMNTLKTKKISARDNVDFFHCISNFLKFLTINSVWFDQISKSFKIDVNSVVRKYIYNEVPHSLKKLILWLLDAKINILAFMQNINQILTNTNFLNPDFDWDLVIKKDLLTYIQKVSPEVIESFKNLQNKVVSRSDINRRLATEIDTNIWYFIDILVWDKPESYLFATSLLSDAVPEIFEWYFSNTVEDFEEIFQLLKNLLSWIEAFWQALDIPKKQKYENTLKRNEKRISAWKTPEEVKEFVPMKQKPYLDIKQAVMKKLFRFQREENDPLVMMKTAQNVYAKMYIDGYTSWKEVLHILSVNYGGSLVWYFAKHVFEKMEWYNKLLINIWNIVYSIYDLKNANDFLSIVDYPFAEIIWEFQSECVKDFFSKQSRLIIFDDNTSSGRTLSDLKKIAQNCWFYWKVDAFACRTSSRLELYDQNISKDDILNIIAPSATKVRKTRIWKVKRWYKEFISLYIWNNIYKQTLYNKEDIF